MKIRIKGNTVRFRLSKPEVAALAENGTLEEKTEFVSGTLVYAVKQSEEASFFADFANNSITLYVPHRSLQTWTHTEQTSMDGCMALPNGNTLCLLLEKDFKCIDLDVREDQSDYFENPQVNC